MSTVSKVLIHTYKLPLWSILLSASIAFTIGLASTLGVYRFIHQAEQEIHTLSAQLTASSNATLALESQLASVSAELMTLKSTDYVVENATLARDIRSFERSLTSVIGVYEELQSLKDQSRKINTVEPLFTQAITRLSRRDVVGATQSMASISAIFAAIKQEEAGRVDIPANVAQNNNPPGSGFSRQSVAALDTRYLVDVVAGDLTSTKVIVDTASGNDCRNECPVLSLGDYVARNGAYAGINGSYFCPASYPSCAGKTNSFDTLLMNKNKTYFNSDNNVYSTVPAVIFLGSSVRFVGRSLDWGRDTGIDSMIANQPLVLSGGNVVFGGDGDPKKGSKGARSFVANKGNVVYIGVVHGVTVAEMGHVLKAMGMENGLNLDSGGSTALWFSGYKVGPGRHIPNAILFVRK